MIGTLAIVGNPLKRGFNMRKRKSHTGKRRYHRIRHNPSRGLSSGLSMGNLGSVMSHALPIGIGAVGGILLPKLIPNATPVVKYLVPAGLGIVVPMILSGFIGRKNAFLVATGAVAVIIIQAVDDLMASTGAGVTPPTGTTTTGDAELHDRDLNDVFKDELHDVGMEDDMHDDMHDSNYP